LFIGAAAGGAFGALVGGLSGGDVFRLERKSVEEKHATLRAILSREGRVVASHPSPEWDVVQLKNGSVIRGSIVEFVPDSSVRVLTADSSLFVFNMTEVARVSRETRPSERTDRRREIEPARLDSRGPSPRFTMSFSGGVGFPVGDFGDKSGGSAGVASVGFVGGADAGIKISPAADVLLSFYYSTNAVDESALGIPSGANVDVSSWKGIWPMIGLRVGSIDDEILGVFGIGQIGLLAGSSPEISASSLGIPTLLTSSDATSVAFSIGFGIIVNRHLTISGRYFYGSPEYEVTVNTGSSTITGKGAQHTSIVFAGVGIIF
jgi:hypothetical protein